MRNISVVFRKEMLELLRNKRTLFVVFILPVLMYPLLTVGFTQLVMMQMEKIHKDVYVIAIDSDNSEYAKCLFDNEQFVFIEHSESSDSMLSKGDIEAILSTPESFSDSLSNNIPIDINIAFDGANEKSQAAKEKLEKRVNAIKDSLLSERLISLGLSEKDLYPVKPVPENRAGDKRMGGFVFGRMLAFILVAMVLTGAYNGAVDMFAGERERGTLETLLVSPASRFEIVMGKYLTVFFITVAVAVLNLGSMALTLIFGVKGMGGGSGLPLSFGMDFNVVLILVGAFLPFSALFAALFLLISAFARNYKEAQSFLTPVFMGAYSPP
jgi:sodium transport system permease protein